MTTLYRLYDSHGDLQEVYAMRSILRIVKASKMTRSEAKSLGYGDDPNVFDMDPLADFQTRWTESHKAA